MQEPRAEIIKHDGVDAAVGENVANLLGGKERRQRNQHGAGDLRREIDRNPVRRVVCGNRGHAYPVVGENCGNARGARVELGVAQRLVATTQRDRGGSLRGMVPQRAQRRVHGSSAASAAMLGVRSRGHQRGTVAQ
jgi:hypothetical protein